MHSTSTPSLQYSSPTFAGDRRLDAHNGLAAESFKSRSQLSQHFMAFFL
jgi:hypothetical protein